ncbi:hypothetical protein [uncultured Croceitalea sp.]|uniref:hypothetical protein n=1 Tax=uncultured Croceitalea sp. TaxID=1798908 RepID=UPI003306816C
MKFNIESRPNPLRQLDNFKQLKTVLKSIKADQDGKFLNALLMHCESLHNVIAKDFHIADHEHIDIQCEVFFNFPLSSIAWIRKGSHHCLRQFDKSGVEATFKERKELSRYLQSLEHIPSLIVPIKLELTQKIGDAKSKFVYEVVG